MARPSRDRIVLGVRLPKTLIRKAKIEAVKHDMTLQALVERALREFLRRKGERHGTQ